MYETTNAKIFDLGKVAQRETKIRRRAFTLPSGDTTITTPQDRLAKRNRTIAARYYYWTEIKRRRFDDVMKILSDYEFFCGRAHHTERTGRPRRTATLAAAATPNNTEAGKAVPRLRVALIKELRFINHPIHFQVIGSALRRGADAF